MMNNMTPAVKQLLIINIIFFLGSFLVPLASDLFSLHYIESNDFKLWQLITHMFMHDGIPHIAFNMFALVSFGSVLENMWGSKKFLFFYFSCGLGAALLQLGVNYYELHQTLSSVSNLNLEPNTLHQILNVHFNDNNLYRGDLFQSGIQPILEKAGKWNLINDESFKVLFDSAIQVNSKMLGASGAIYGLLVAFTFMFPNAELSLMFIPIPVKAKYFVPIYMFLYDGLFGILGGSLMGINSGVAHFAHVGGALIGFIIMWYWKKNSFNDKRWN